LTIHSCKWEQWKKDVDRAFGLQSHIRLLKEEKGHMSSLLGYILSYRLPSPIYSIFLNERHFLFQFREVETCRPYKVTSTKKFFKVYYERNKEDKDLLCEL